MTKVQARKDGRRCVLSAKGHATGSVEVCAAVSGILYALAGYLTNVVRERHIEIYENRMEEADVLLDYSGDEKTTAAFEMAVIGLAQIGQQYPEFLQVEFQEN